MNIPLDASPRVQQAFRDIDRVIAGWTGVGNIDLRGRKFLNAGAPTSGTDFVRLADLQDAIDGLDRGAATEAPIEDLIIFDTHANRANYAPEAFRGRLFVEGDRLALYGSTIVAGVRTWKHLASYMVGSGAGRPGDLGTYDEGFTFRQIDAAAGDVIWEWSGALWHYLTGTLKGVLADIPAAADANIGALYHATDYDRVYVSTGLAWTDAPGQPKRGLQFFTGNPGTGWALADGSSVTLSTSGAGTAAFTTPNLINRFVRAATVSGGTGGGSTHNHAIDPPSTTSGGPSATVSVDNVGGGSTVSVPTAAATYNVDIASFNSDTQNHTPPYLDLLPYWRL